MITFPPEDRIRLVPLAEDEAGRGLFRLAADVSVYARVGNRRRFVLDIIRKGALTDGASVPGLLRAWFDPWGRGATAYLWHDDLLRRTDVPKWEADLLFLYALRSLGVPAFRATLMYFAVRTRRPSTEVAA